MIGLGFVSTVGVTIFVTRISKRAIEHEIAESRATVPAPPARSTEDPRHSR
jgi:hypothetical protein